MFGYVEWTEEKRRPGGGERQILHLRFYGAALLRRRRTPEPVVRVRCAAAARRMRRLGVERAVFPADFPYTEEFVRRGILPVDTLPLYRSLAAELVRVLLAERTVSPGEATVAVCGEHLSAEVARTVTELCVRNRYVTLSVGGEGETLCRQLRREYGVSLLRTDDPERLKEADARVLFAPREGLPAGLETLELYVGGTTPAFLLRLAGEREAEVPDGCDRAQLFAALRAAGTLKSGQIEVCGSASCA